jgi:DNA-3-methyladenine glycosylase
VVAPQLLGCTLISRTPEGEVAGRIVEVEVYHGASDPASHAYRGLTPRTKPMFAAGGAIYVYLSYGLHTCVNIVTGPAGEAQAVLIRALEPMAGQELMAIRRGTTNSRLLARGPGRVGQALGISRTMSGQTLGQTLTLIRPAVPLAASDMGVGPRIGIRQAADRPWRFWLTHSPFVSR